MAEETLFAFNFGMFRLIAVIFCGLMSIVCNAFNSLVLWNNKCGFKEVNRLLLRVLAGVDFFTGLLVIHIEYMYVLSNIPSRWDGFCMYIYPCLVFVSLLSMFLIGLVSLDRFIAIKLPLRYPILMKRSRVYGAIFVVTLITLFNSACTTWGEIPFDGFYFHNSTRFCRVRFETRSHRVMLGIAFNITALTLVLVFLVNAYLLKVIIQHKQRRRQLMKQQTGRRDSKAFLISGIISAEDFKTIRVFITINVAYYICWFPSVAKVTYSWFHQESDISEMAEFFIYYPVYCNSWVNAVVYLLMHREYRKVAASYLSFSSNTEHINSERQTSLSC